MTLATWITPDDVVVALGGTTPADDAWLIQVTSAANDFAYERRLHAGYHDEVDAAPNDRVKTGTTLYAVALFRERGSVDSFASFEDFTTGVLPPSTFGQVNRLLGIPRPAVDAPPVLPVVSPL